MSSSLPIDRTTLSSDILDLVRKTDLSILTSKFVRTEIEKKHAVDLKEHRKEIDAIIRNSIENLESKKSSGISKSTNGTASSNNSAGHELSPPSKNETSNSIADLSFDDDNDIYSAVKRRRARQTIQRKPPAKKPKQSKETGVKKKTAFTRVCVLSDELSAILNRKYMRRSDVVKLMWGYFKQHELLDPVDRRYVRVDDRMRTVFGGTKRIQAFGMMKVLKNHIKDLEFLDEDTRRTAMHEIEQLEDNGELNYGTAPSAGPSKSTVEDSESSESSSDEEDEPIKSSSSASSRNKNASSQSSKAEEPRATKLVLRISKKNDRVVSVKVNDEEESRNAHLDSANDDSLNQIQSSNASTADMDGPPKLELEVPNDVDSSSRSSSSSSSSGSSSGSGSSSSASSSPEPSSKPTTRKHVPNDLHLSESESDSDD